ncbi:MAG TPA: hypothetical protein VFQ53_08360 [Kofleriaceae bacterium]|nr:hypothetical protein [Kofleriaceae bacterium]
MRYLLASLALVVACSDGDPAPSAEITAAAPDALAPADDARDDLTITVRYTDADGDLGTGTAEVHDCRGDALVTPLPIPAIAPDALGDAHISGTLELHVNDVGAAAIDALPATCAELGVAELAADQAVFCVVLVDAAGHRGAGDCTAPIALEL